MPDNEYLKSLERMRRNWSLGGNQAVNPSDDTTAIGGDLSAYAYMRTRVPQPEQQPIQPQSNASEGNWFEKSMKNVFGFVDELAAKFGAGFVNGWEGILDLGATALGALGDATGWWDGKVLTDWAKQDIGTALAEWTKTYANLTPWGIASNIASGNYADGEWWSNAGKSGYDILNSGLFFSNELGDMRQEADRYYQLNDEALQDMGQFGEFLGGAAHSVGFMLPSIMTAGAAGAAGAGQTAVKAVSLATMGLGAAGKGSEEALNEGASSGKALAYGAASGAIEVASEIAVGPVLEKLGIGVNRIGGVVGKKAAAKAGEKAIASAAKDIAKSMIEEGVEEVFSAVLEPVAKSIYKGKDELKQYGSTDFWFGTNGHFNESVVGQFASGAVVGGLSSGVSTASLYRKVGPEYYKSVGKLQEVAENKAKIDRLAERGQQNSERYRSLVEENAKLTAELAVELNDANQKSTKAQKAEFAKMLSDPQGYMKAIESEDSSKSLSDFIETRIKEMGDPTKSHIRSTLNELRAQYGTDTKVSFEAMDDDTYALYDRKADTIKVNEKYLDTDGGKAFAHEYFGHALYDSLSKADQQRFFGEISKYDQELIDEVKAEYGKDGHDIVREETIAHFLQRSFDGKTTGEQLAQIKKVFRNRSLLQRIFEPMGKVARSFKGNAILNSYAKALKEFAKKSNSPKLIATAVKEAKGQELTASEQEEAKANKSVFDALVDIFRSESEAKSQMASKNIEKAKAKDSEGKTLTKEQQEFFKDSKARDKEGNLQVMYHGSPNAGFTVFDSKYHAGANGSESSGNIHGGREVNWFTSSPDTAQTYVTELPNGTRLDKVSTIKEFDEYLSDFIKGMGYDEGQMKYRHKVENFWFKNVSDIDFDSDFREQYALGMNGVWHDFDISDTEKEGYKKGIRLILEYDSWSGTHETDEYRYINLDEAKRGLYEIFEDDDEMMTGGGIYDYESKSSLYEVYLNIKRPLTIDAKSKNWDDISFEDASEYKKVSQDALANNIDLLSDEDIDFAVERENSSELNELFEGKSEMSLSEKKKALEKYLKESRSWDYWELPVDSKLPGENKATTRSIVDYAVSKGDEYDGVIIRNVKDNGVVSGMAQSGLYSDVVVTIESANQIKSVDNQNPTDNDDIRYSRKLKKASSEEEEVKVYRDFDVEAALSSHPNATPMQKRTARLVSASKGQRIDDRYARPLSSGRKVITFLNGDVLVTYPKGTVLPGIRDITEDYPSWLSDKGRWYYYNPLPEERRDGAKWGDMSEKSEMRKITHPLNKVIEADWVRDAKKAKRKHIDIRGVTFDPYALSTALDALGVPKGASVQVYVGATKLRFGHLFMEYDGKRAQVFGDPMKDDQIAEMRKKIAEQQKRQAKPNKEDVSEKPSPKKPETSSLPSPKRNKDGKVVTVSVLDKTRGVRQVNVVADLGNDLYAVSANQGEKKFVQAVSSQTGISVSPIRETVDELRSYVEKNGKEIAEKTAKYLNSDKYKKRLRESIAKANGERTERVEADSRMKLAKPEAEEKKETPKPSKKEKAAQETKPAKAEAGKETESAGKPAIIFKSYDTVKGIVREAASYIEATLNSRDPSKEGYHVSLPKNFTSVVDKSFTEINSVQDSAKEAERMTEILLDSTIERMEDGAYAGVGTLRDILSIPEAVSIRSAVKSLIDGSDNQEAQSKATRKFEVALNKALGQKTDVKSKVSRTRVLTRLRDSARRRVGRYLEATNDEAGRNGLNQLLKPFVDLHGSSSRNDAFSAKGFKDALNAALGWYTEDNLAKNYPELPFYPTIRSAIEDLYDSMGEPTTRTRAGQQYKESGNLSAEQMQKAIDAMRMINAAIADMTQRHINDIAPAALQGSMAIKRSKYGKGKGIFSRLFRKWKRGFAPAYSVVNEILGGDSEIARIMTFGMQDAINSKQMYVGSYSDGISKKLKELGIRKDFDSRRFLIKDMDLTADQALGLYVSLRVQANYDAINESGIQYRTKGDGRLSQVMYKGDAASLKSAIDSALPESYRKLGDYLLKTMNGSVKEEYIGMFEDRFGKFSGRNEIGEVGDESYWPLFRSYQYLNSAEKAVHNAAAVFSRAKRRTNTTRNAVLVSGALSSFDSYIDQLSGEIYVKPIYRRAVAILNAKAADGKSIMEILATERDPKDSDYIRTTLLDILGANPYASNDVLSKAMSAFSVAKLSLNIGTVPKQFASIWTSNIPMRRSAKGVLSNIFKSDKVRSEYRELVDEIGGLKYREAGKGVLRANADAASGMVEKIAKVGMFGISKMDMFTVSTGVVSLMHIAEDQLGLEIGTKANKDWVKAHWSEFELSQIGSGPLSKNAIQRGDHGLLMRYLFGFLQGANRAAFGSQINKIGLWLRNRNSSRDSLQKAYDSAKSRADKAQASYDAEQTDEARLELIDAKAEMIDAESRLNDFKRYEVAGGKSIPVNMAAGLIAQGIFVALISELMRHIKGKKDWDEWDLAEIGANVGLAITVDWLPLVNAISSMIKGYDVQVPAVEIMNEMVTVINEGKNQNWRAMARRLAILIGDATGIPFQTIYDYIYGTVKAFDPELAYRFNSLAYGSTLAKAKETLGKAAKKNDADSSRKMVSLILKDHTVGSASEDVSSEIARLYLNGHDALPSSISGSYTDDDGNSVKMTSEQTERFQTMYSQADREVSEMLKISDYRRMDDADKAKAIKRVYDLYKAYAKQGATGVQPSGKLLSIMVGTKGNVQVGKFVLGMMRLNSIESTKLMSRKEIALRTVNRMSGFTKAEKALLLWLSGYGIDDSAKSMVRNYLRSSGMPSKDAKALTE